MSTLLDTEEITSAHYRRLVIPKYRLVDGEERKVGERIIHEPCAELKAMQKEILQEMSACKSAFTSNVSHAFTKNRSIVTMAAPHVGRRYLVKVDIQDFFPSINKDKARIALLNAGYPRQLIRKILQFCFLDGVLPQGAPSSPAIANVVGRLIDKRMVGLCAKWRTVISPRPLSHTPFNTHLSTRVEPIIYSRYADDLVFSSDYPLLHHIRFPVIRILRLSGFTVNQGKIVASGSPRRLVVCGVTVNSKLSKPRPYRKKLRALVHKMWKEHIQGTSRNGVIIDSKTNDPITVEQLQGQIAHVFQINPDQARSLTNKLDQVKRMLHASP